MREPRKYTIKQLLVANSKFVIPKYQRGYDWKGDAQVKDLFSDLISCLESQYSSSLFLGSMIFDVSREKDQSTVEIIDGQQRFTTIMITLIAARNYARHVLGNEKLALKEQESLQIEDPYTDTIFDRFDASESIREVYRHMSDYEWRGDSFPDFVVMPDKAKKAVKRQASRVEPIYKYAFQQISMHCEKDLGAFQRFMKQLYHDTYIIRIDVDEQSEAFEIFERTNARGKPLEVSDLLKNYLFSKDKELLSQSMEQVWESISEDAGNNIIRVLKYFWISRRGHVVNRDLYRNLRIYASERDVTDFVTELQEFSSFFRAFYANEPSQLEHWLHGRGVSSNSMYLREITRSCNALKAFRVTQALPVLFSVIVAYLALPEDQQKPKTLINIFRCVESHHYINNRICNRIGNEVEKLYASYSDRFFNGDSFYSTWQDFEKDLLSRTAERDEFASQFGFIAYSNPNDRVTIRYTFDMLCNVGMKEGQRVNLIDYYQLENGVESVFNIEHFYSQSLATEDEDFVHEIGNLLVVPKQINGILQNDDFATKIAKLRNPENYANKINHVPPYVQSFVTEAEQLDEWNEQAITDRTDRLASQAYQAARYGYAYK
jgi:hypothetical protein